MGLTHLDQISGTANVKLVAALPTAPSGYYGDNVRISEWQGGEQVFNTSDNRYYIQTNTSGSTASWKRLLDQAATTTTSTSTSSSTSTSTSSSTTTGA